MSRMLGALETAETLSSLYAPFNAVGIVSLSMGPQPDEIKMALLELQNRHPLLRMKITQKKNKFYFENRSSSIIPFVSIERKSNDHWKIIVEKELNNNLNLHKGPLFRCTYLYSKTAESKSEIIMTFHHSIVDASSINQIFHELLDSCSGRSNPDNKKNIPSLQVIPAEEIFFPSSQQGIQRKRRMLFFMIKQIGNEIKYQRKQKEKKQPVIHKPFQCKIIPLYLSEEQTKNLISQCRKKRISLNSYLSAAMIKAVLHKLYSLPDGIFRHVVFINLRDYLKPPVTDDHIGSYHGLMRMDVVLNKKQTILELAQNIHNQIHMASKKGDKFTATLLAPKMMNMHIKSGKMRMGMTALSYSGVSSLLPSYRDIRVHAIHGFVSNFPIGPEYSASARIFDKKLFLDFLYLDIDMEKATASNIADEIMDYIQAKTI